jgi:hypothetical protein
MEKPIYTNSDSIRFGEILGLVLLCLIWTNQIQAAAVLDFKITQKQGDGKQTVSIQNEQIWIEGLGGHNELAALYDHKTNQLALINHAHKSYTVVSEKTIRHLSEQIMLVAPMLKGFGAQLKTLDASQRAKWEKMLDGFPIDALATAQDQVAKGRIKPHGKEERVAEIPCKPYRISSAEKNMGDFCLANSEALGLNPEDTRLVADFSSFIHQLLLDAGSLMQYTGFSLNSEDLTSLQGIPVSFREGGGNHLSVKLQSIGQNLPNGKRFNIPESYSPEKFKLW